MRAEATKTCNYCGHNFWALDECPKCLDDFAKAALTGLISNQHTIESLFRNTPAEANPLLEGAKGVYRWARAMMEARDK